VLRACRQVLVPSGLIAFYTIFIAPGLSDADYRRAARSGAPGITSWRRSQDDLLLAAGFLDISETDVTAEYLRVARLWYEGRQRHAAELEQVEGETQFAERQRDNKAASAAIEAGLLRRALFVAKRPP